jgi:hypothetical protein
MTSVTTFAKSYGIEDFVKTVKKTGTHSNGQNRQVLHKIGCANFDIKQLQETNLNALATRVELFVNE